jgi:hypothetical protein
MTMHQGLPLVLDHHNRSKGAAPLTPKQEPDTASPLAGVTGVSAYIISLSDRLASDSDMQALVVILAGTVKDFDLIRLCPIAVAF